MWSAWWSSNYKFCGTSNWNCLISSYHSSLSCPLFISEFVLSKFVFYLSFLASFLVDPSLILFLDLFLACVILLLLVCVVSLHRLVLVGQRWAQAADGVLMTCQCQGLLLLMLLLPLACVHLNGSSSSQLLLLLLLLPLACVHPNGSSSSQPLLLLLLLQLACVHANGSSSDGDYSY